MSLTRQTAVRMPQAPPVAALVIALCLLGTLTPGAICAADDPFPELDAIQGNVGFWVQVFSEWKLGQVAVHDLRYPEVVYEVADLPGAVADRYTKQQKEFIEDLNERWRDRLRAAAKQSAGGEQLTAAQREWVDRLTTACGKDCLSDAHERVRTQRGLRERFRRGVEISNRYDRRIREIFRRAGLPEDLAFLPHVESSFQATARSSAGAVGVWQFTRGTGKRFMSIDAAVDERLDPLAAAHAAAGYLAKAHADLGDWPIALTSYNHGVTGMRRAVAQHGADYEAIFRRYEGRRFGFASRNFYSEFLAARIVAREPERFFADLSPEAEFDLDRIELDRRTTPARIARAHDVALDELAAINPSWSRRAVRSDLALPAGLNVWLPRGNLERLARSGVTPSVRLAGWIDGQGRYVVKRGDSLSMISQTYGVDLSTLRRLNGLPSGSSLIRVGQEIRLSDGAAETIHVVRRGENLSAIAGDRGMKLAELRRLNGMSPNEHLIHVGQKLRVRDTNEVHVVRRGDNLIRIAASYGVRLADLLYVNALSRASIIHPGQKLQIP